MNQSQGIEVYMAKQGQLVQSYLITLVDGTGSMSGEYQAVIDAHQAVFSYLGDKKMDYQWEENLYPFTPFKSAGSGNISKTFQSIFEKLLTQTFPANITFLFISDGQEHFKLEEISQQIKQVKTKYLIQFISVAVGDCFPSQISNTLRNEIHNQNSSCPAVFKVNRKHRSFDILYKEFSDIFQEIKKYLNVQEKHFETSEPVFQTLVSEKPSTKVAPNEPFFRKIDEQSAPLIIENEIIKPTDDPVNISKLISNSVEQELIIAASDPNHSYKEGFSKISELGQKILDTAHFDNNNDSDEIKQQASSQIYLASNIAEGNLDLKKNEKEMTDLQKDIRDPIKVLEYVEKNAQEIEQKEWTQEKAKLRMQGQFNNTKLGCYVKSKVTQKQLDLIESIWSITVEGLNNYKKVIQKDSQCDLNKLLSELKTLIDRQLQKIFEKQSVNELQDKHFIILKELNDTLKDMNTLILQKDKIKVNEVFQFIDSRSKPITEITVNQTGAIFDQSDEFAFLPKSLQTLFRDDEDELEKMIVIVFDENQSMENEIQAAKSNYLQVFSELSKDQRIEISWQNGQFSLLENKQQSCGSLLEIFQKLEPTHNLRNKCINLCLVSDGKTDYGSLHKATKQVKQNQYLIKLIYLTVGSYLKNYLEGIILSKFQNREVKGKPIIKVIPRAISNKFETQQQSLNKSTTVPKIDSQFIKIFEDILYITKKENNQKVNLNQY